MKSRLIILSDLWGKEKSNWVSAYQELLCDSFEIQFYDCCELGEISKAVFTEENLHKQFVNGGIEIAIKNLLNKEKGEIKILAFSVGGTIAWKAALKGLKVIDLFAISSTRLRYETQRPNCRISLYFGEKDSNRPSPEWFEKYRLLPKIYSEKKHEMYLEADIVIGICNQIINEEVYSVDNNINPYI